MTEYPPVDWKGPLECEWFGIPVKLVEWGKECKWVQIGFGQYMYNNDGTCVEGGPMVFNPADHVAMMKVEGRS